MRGLNRRRGVSLSLSLPSPGTSHVGRRDATASLAPAAGTALYSESLAPFHLRPAASLVSVPFAPRLLEGFELRPVDPPLSIPATPLNTLRPSRASRNDRTNPSLIPRERSTSRISVRDFQKNS